MGWAVWSRVEFALSEDVAADFALAAEYGEKALASGEYGAPHFLLGVIRAYQERHEEAALHADRILALNEGDGETLAGAGYMRIAGGDAEEGIRLIKEGMRLYPYHPEWMPLVMGSALLMLNRHDELRALTKELLSKETRDARAHVVSLAYLAAISIFEGEEEEARSHVRRLLALKPDATTAFFLTAPGIFPYKDKAFLDRYMNALRAAGLPDPEPEEPAAAIPAKPRVAVLPFDNFGGEDWFADGLTEDLITRLSHFDDLAVIARNSTFRYKGKPVDVREVGRDLEVDYVVEGSVRRSGETLRVTAQLLNAKDGAHVWAEKYDRPLTAENLFEVQDDVTARIAGALGGHTGQIAVERQLVNLDEYDCVLMTRQVLQTIDAALHAKATECLEAALQDNPGYALSWASLSFLHQMEATYGLNARPDPIARTLDAAQKAIGADPDSAYGFHALSKAWFLSKNRSKAVAAMKHAMDLNPNDPDLIGTAGFLLIHLGSLDDGKPLVDRAFDLTPFPPQWFYYALFHYHFQRGEFAAAYDAVDRTDTSPGAYYQYLFGAAALVSLDRMAEAAALIEKAREAEPNLEEATRPVPDLWWWALPDKGQGYVEALAKVGLDMR